MRLPRFIAFALVPVGLAAGAVAFARGPHGEHHGAGHGPFGPAARFLHMVSSLDLSPAQQTKVAAIRDAGRAEMRAGVAAHMADGDALVAAVRAGRHTRAEVHAKVQQRAEEREAKAHDFADQLFDLYETLTPAQREALADEMEERLARAEERLEGAPPVAEPAAPKRGGR